MNNYNISYSPAKHYQHINFQKKIIITINVIHPVLFNLFGWFI